MTDIECIETGCHETRVHLPVPHGVLTDEFCSWACLVAFASTKWYGDKTPQLPVKVYQGYTPVNAPTMDLSLIMPEQRVGYDRAHARTWQEVE